MSFFDRVFNTKKYQDELVEKINATNHRPAFLNMPGSNMRLHNDNIHPHQPLSIYHQKISFENLEHRDWQSKHNSHLNKLTQGVANFLTKKVPYPFMYAEVNLHEQSTEENITPEKETNTATETVDVREISENSKRKSNAFRPGNPSQDPQRDQFPMQDEGMGVFGQQGAVTQPQHYTLRRDLMDKYMTLWGERDANKQNMFYVIKKSLHKGLATKTACIVRRRYSGRVQYFVFGANQIIGTKGPGRIIKEVGIRWSNWSLHEDTSSKNATKEGIQWFTVGVDCVLFIPFPCEEDPLGSSFLQSVWDLGIYQQQNRYLSSLWIWNGGIADKYYRIPNTTESSVLAQLEDHMKAPMLKPGMIMKHPPGISPETVQNLFQVETTATNEPAWDIHNDIYSQDSPFPKEFLTGQTETGALGGSAPEVNKQKEDEVMMQWFHILDPLIKDINETFFEGTPEEFKDVVIIPFIDELLNSGSGSGGMGPSDTVSQKDPKGSKDPEKKESPKKEETIDVRVLKTSKQNSAKVNSITSVGRTYIGNLFSEGWLPQDDGTREFISADTIKEFVEKDFSTKEGYFGWEHPTNDPMKITPVNSIGKYKIIGYDEKRKTDITEFTIFESDAPDEIYTSPAYYSRDITRPDGSVEQTAITLVNAVATKNPRSMGKTKAIRMT